MDSFYIAASLYIVVIISVLIILYCMFRTPESKRLNLEDVETTTLVAMHTFYETCEDRRAEEVAKELRRRKLVQEPSSNGISIWIKENDG